MQSTQHAGGVWTLIATCRHRDGQLTACIVHPDPPLHRFCLHTTAGTATWPVTAPRAPALLLFVCNSSRSKMAQLGNLQLGGLQPAVSVWRALRLSFGQRGASGLAAATRLQPQQQVRAGLAMAHCWQWALVAAAAAALWRRHRCRHCQTISVRIPPCRRHPGCCMPGSSLAG